MEGPVPQVEDPSRPAENRREPEPPPSRTISEFMAAPRGSWPPVEFFPGFGNIPHPRRSPEGCRERGLRRGRDVRRARPGRGDAGEAELDPPGSIRCPWRGPPADVIRQTAPGARGCGSRRGPSANQVIDAQRAASILEIHGGERFLQVSVSAFASLIPRSSSRMRSCVAR